MRVKYVANIDGFHELIKGKIYNVAAKERSWFRIIDESGEDYLYPPELFEVIGEYNIRASDDNQL